MQKTPVTRLLMVPADPFWRRVWLLYLALAAMILIATIWLAGDFGRDQGLAALAQRGRAAAELNATVLRAELDKQRSMPLVVALAGDVLGAVRSKDPAALRGLDEKLETLNAGARASVIYILDAQGLTLAASNWRAPDSFVGTNYQFRPYYREAMATGSAELFALGTVSHRPGLYIARRIDAPDGPLGVAVVKVEFDGLEARWKSAGDPIYVTDEQGIVLLSSVPEWRFRAETPISDPKAGQIRESLQFGDAPLLPLPIEPRGVDAPVQNVEALMPARQQPEAFLAVTTPVPSTPWALHQLLASPTAVAAGEGNARASALLIVVPLLAIVTFLIFRSGAAARLAARNALVQQELEQAIGERTSELSEANRRLRGEMDERQKAEARERTIREDLMQANRLASLGQIAAGVAHEINQPVGAIRAYAENGQVFAERGEIGPLKSNLMAIAGMTERIGAITDELRAFSRKGSGAAEPTSVAAAIEGTLLLLGSRLRSEGIETAVELPPASLKVLAQRIRLEQVLVNLVQNAVEALEGVPNGQIGIRHEIAGDEVRILIEDNGPGMAPEIMERLFVPFTTGKAQGLGLGLVISHDIVTEFGGKLVVVNRPGGGASFAVHLRRAA